MFQGGRPLDWQSDPLEVLSRWPSDRRIFMLHSGRADTRWSRYSVLAQPTDAVRYHRGQTQFSDPHHRLFDAASLTHEPFDDLRRILRADAGRSLWLGTLGYDLARSIEHLPKPAADDRGWPDMQLERCAGWLIHDNQTHRWTAHGSYQNKPPTLHQPQASDVAPSFTTDPLIPSQTADRVKASVQRAIDYIARGDVFQVNLAQRFTARFAGSPRAFYAGLCQQSPAWYGALGELTRFSENEPQRTLASISPELFLDVSPAGRITTRPIKGTRPATADADALRDSAKDQAELAMIVDLMRNDLGRVCSIGSIRVQDPRTIESHPTVHHGVATVTGDLAPQHDLIDLLRATLPGGSITGAPKVRAMQIIDELEPARRGAYCGAIGLIHGEQALFNIAIRTAVIQQDRVNGRGFADVWVGGGIVADSDPDCEYQEMLDKAKAIRDALNHPKHNDPRASREPSATEPQHASDHNA